MNRDVAFTITVEDEPGSPYPILSEKVTSEQKAKTLAIELAITHKNKYVYIHFYRMSDSQQGFLNRDGYGITACNWASPYKNTYT